MRRLGDAAGLFEPACSTGAGEPLLSRYENLGLADSPQGWTDILDRYAKAVSA